MLLAVGLDGKIYYKFYILVLACFVLFMWTKICTRNLAIFK